MITKKRVTQILCIIDESDKNLNAELDKKNCDCPTIEDI